MNARTRLRISLAVTAALGTGALALGAAIPVAAAAPAEGEQHATVSVLHAVPDLTVDVYANGEELLPGFEPGTLTDPLTLDAGTYDLEIFPAGEGPEGQPALQQTVDVPAGANATVVAHLSAAGEPELNAFVNDTEPVAAGSARLTVRHVAAAPAVDVRAGGEPVFEGLENPNEESAEVDAGTLSADVVLAGTDTVALGPADLELAEGTGTIVYAWGSAEDENLDLAVQTIDGLHSAPGEVDAGYGTAAPAANSSAAWIAWSGAAGVAGVAGAALISRRVLQRS